MTEQDQLEQYNEERMHEAYYQEQQDEYEAAQALSDPSGSRNYHGFDQHYIDIQPDVVIVSYEVIKENTKDNHE